MQVKRIFPKALLTEEWGLPHGDADVVISDDIEDTSRWSEHHTLIFKAPDDGKVYRVYYSTGLTEYQDESPWEYDTEIEGVEMVKRKVLVYKYLPVEEKA